MRTINFTDIVKKAWHKYAPDITINSIYDISAKVSTNHVFKIDLHKHEPVIAKLSYFGKYEHFKEDHIAINILANNLPAPYENFLSRSLTKDGEVFIYRHTNRILDAWVAFYQPLEVNIKLPKQQEESTIIRLGEELASFHKECTAVQDKLPPFTKTMQYDVNHLLEIVGSDLGRYIHRNYEDAIRHQCDSFLNNLDALDFEELPTIPVFVDWNIGNFTVDENMNFYSRWDYDWFRITNRVMDFYFFSRVVSSKGDQTIFSYNIDTLMEDRFLLFLQAYHRVYPLTEKEILFIKEAYRFFILNYVIKEGDYFFHELYSSRLRMEAFEVYFPELEEKFDADRLKRALEL